jgi:predicted nucleic acid-binding protein
MVLIDTSVWIRFLMGREPFVGELKRLLALGEAAAHDLIHGELLIGNFGGRKNLLDDYDKLFQAAIVPHRDVVAFVELRNLGGRGIGWIDVHLLASALVNRLRLWTADSRLSVAAEEFGVGHRIPN